MICRLDHVMKMNDHDDYITYERVIELEKIMRTS